RALTRDNAGCSDQGYSDCGPDDFRHAEGTSFAAPLVTAAAALLFAQSPNLHANQVETILERSADDLNAATGCSACPPLRHSLSGGGRLDVAGALTALAKLPVPPPDHFEPNDDVGAQTARLTGARGKLAATVDYWDDPSDIYPVELAGGAHLRLSVNGLAAASMRLWSPQTRTVYGASAQKLALASSRQVGGAQRLGYAVPAGKG